MKTQLSLLDRAWVRFNVPLVLEHFKDGREFTADDLHEVVSVPENRNLYGVLMSQCRPKLEKLGYRPSKRLDRNGGVVAVWKIKNVL